MHRHSESISLSLASAAGWPTVLGQADDSASALLRLLPILAVCIVLGSILLLVLSLVRRRMRSDEGVARDFTLNDLRKLRAEGKLSDEEMEKAKSALVGRVHTKIATRLPPDAERSAGDVKH